MTNSIKIPSKEQRLAQIVKDLCIQAALNGYENASMSGLCHEGAWEAAISAIRNIDVELILNEDD